MSGAHLDDNSPEGKGSEEKHEIIAVKREVGRIDFHQANIEDLKKVPKLLDQVYRSVLVRGTDYDQIEGSSKPSLLKAGAELLAGWLKITPDSRIVKQEESYDKPYFNYIIETKLYDQNGLYIGNGFGSCNSKEPSYAFRWIYESDIPPDIDKSRLLKRWDGKYRVDATANDIFAKANAILKKAKKRAFVDAILTVTGASRIFTQDIGEDGEEEKAETQSPAASIRPASEKTPEPKQATAHHNEGWEIRVPLIEDTTMKQIPLLQGDVRVGMVNVLADSTGLSIVPKSPIPANHSTIERFLCPRVLDEMVAKHLGIEYQISTGEDNMLNAIVLRGPLNDVLIKDLANAARWAFSRALEKTNPSA